MLRGLDFVYVYTDDILVASGSEEEHRGHLTQLFRRLIEYGVMINLAKCVLGEAVVTFLGHLVSSEGIVPPEDKVIPQNKKQPNNSADSSVQ